MIILLWTAMIFQRSLNKNGFFAEIFHVCCAIIFTDVD